ncbi:hypothetical protein PM082_020813 [Marasmius tenuissimus]|nr:hypothetical protein PM082_020813 [Marasmius tenuissimus]
MGEITERGLVNETGRLPTVHLSVKLLIGHCSSECLGYAYSVGHMSYHRLELSAVCKWSLPFQVETSKLVPFKINKNMSRHVITTEHEGFKVGRQYWRTNQDLIEWLTSPLYQPQSEKIRIERAYTYITVSNSHQRDRNLTSIIAHENCGKVRFEN